MRVSYKKLWKLLIDKDMNKTNLCKETGLSNSTVAKMTRGNCRTQGELRRREVGNVFGSGSRTPVAITILVKTGEQVK